jgi:formylglycine-generating enzyme required for sulfatase activity
METNPSKSSKFKNPQSPVEMVSWVDAIKFCNRLSELQGLEKCYTENSNSKDFGWDYDSSKNGYRLPTEKEWEYAAKAGTQNLWAGTSDKSKLGEYAVYWDDSNSSTHTVPVATKKPNEWGFYDMSGNVLEWCWDKYDPDNHNASAYRVLRGGSWCNEASDLCSARRSDGSPNFRYETLGFRVSRSIVN